MISSVDAKPGYIYLFGALPLGMEMGLLKERKGGRLREEGEVHSRDKGKMYAKGMSVGELTFLWMSRYWEGKRVVQRM